MLAAGATDDAATLLAATELAATELDSIELVSELEATLDVESTEEVFVVAVFGAQPANAPTKSMLAIMMANFFFIKFTPFYFSI